LSRSKTKKETKQMLSITELMRLTRHELCVLLTRTETALSDYPEGTPERRAVLTNMSNIHWARARRDDCRRARPVYECREAGQVA
jgi:hypothetical protein